MCSAAFSFLGSLTRFEAAAPPKLPVQTTAAKPKKEAQVQTELVCFQLLFLEGEFDLLRGCRRVEGQSEGDSCLYIPFALAALRPSIEAAVKAKAKATARGMCVLAFSSLVLVFVFKGTTAIPIGVLVCYLCNENHLTLCDTKTLIPSRT